MEREAKSVMHINGLPIVSSASAEISNDSIGEKGPQQIDESFHSCLSRPKPIDFLDPRFPFSGMERREVTGSRKRVQVF